MVTSAVRRLFESSTKQPSVDDRSSAVLSEAARSFVLPPIATLSLSAWTQALVDRAQSSLVRLSSVVSTLPDLDLAHYILVPNKAVHSTQLGTYSSGVVMLRHDVDNMATACWADVRGWSRYLEALGLGLERMRGGAPVTRQLLCEMHAVLLTGSETTATGFRNSPHWIGSALTDKNFAAPLPQQIDECLDRLERHIREPGSAIVKAAFAHVQFDSIQPFQEGNRRVGNMLVTLMLCNEGIVAKPLLYSSVYRSADRQKYYAELEAVRATHDYDRWIAFFAETVLTNASLAIATGQRIAKVFAEDRQSLRNKPRSAGNLLLIQELLQSRPIVTIASLTNATGLTTPTVTKVLLELKARGLVREITGRTHTRIFAYKRYLDALAAN